MPARAVPERDERALAAAWSGGEPNAFLRLAWETYADDLLRYVLRSGVPANEADDVRQDVFAAVVAGAGGFDGRNFGGWLFAIAKYAVWSRRKHAARERTRAALREALAAGREAGGDPAAPPGFAELVARLRDGLAGENLEIFDALAEDVDDAELAARLTARTARAWNAGMVRSRRKRLRRAADEKGLETWKTLTGMP